jgi:hypothetical protein
VEISRANRILTVIELRRIRKNWEKQDCVRYVLVAKYEPKEVIEMARPKGRSWSQERAKKRGGTNIRGNIKEKWERSKVHGHIRRIGGKKVHVRSYYRHKGKRKGFW